MISQCVADMRSAQVHAHGHAIALTFFVRFLYTCNCCKARFRCHQSCRQSLPLIVNMAMRCNSGILTRSLEDAPAYMLPRGVKYPWELWWDASPVVEDKTTSACRSETAFPHAFPAIRSFNDQWPGQTDYQSLNGSSPYEGECFYFRMLLSVDGWFSLWG